MAQLSREDYEQYQRAVDMLAKSATEKFLEYAEAADFDSLDPAERIEMARELVGIAKDLYLQTRDAAAYVAGAYYADCMEAHGYSVEEDLALLDEEDIDAKADYWASKAFDGSESTEQVVAKVSSWLDGRVRNAADQTVAGSALRDYRKRNLRTTYARVPRGGKTCGYCFMLASYGFQLVADKKLDDIDKVHPNCNCRCVAGIEGQTTMEGYDPDGIRKRLNQCVETIGGEEQVREDWLSLSEDERKKLIARRGSAAKAFAHYKQERISREVETRDWEWVHTGRIPKVDDSSIDTSLLNDEQRHVFDKEFNCARVMANNGFATSLTDDPNTKPIKDVPKFDYVVGNTGSLWEAKCPEGKGYLAVAGNIAKADAKFRKIGKPSQIVLSNLNSGMSDRQFWRYFVESMDDPESDYSNVSMILFVFKDGSIRRWMR